MRFWVFLPAGLALAIAHGGCSSNAPAPATPDASAARAGLGDPVDVPIDGVTHDMVQAFGEGDALFDTAFREPDGLGPLYIRTSCGACHDGAARGPGLVQTMAVVMADGFTASPDQSKLPFGHNERALLAAGAKTPIAPPPGDTSIKISIRVGPPILGRGYMEAVADSEIERIEKEQSMRTDGIHGHINRVVFASVQNSDTSFFAYKQGDPNLIGRFGLKARTATLDDFIAGAFQGDMGITSPMRPVELPNPDGLTDDRKPGVDVPIEMVNTVVNYVRLLAIPRRDITDAGRALFDQVKCSVCHQPSLKTRADYPVKLLAGIDAPVYTDFLLHDWGPEAADGMTDGTATSQQWRTAALIGLRFSKTYLHDGRASSIEEAILFHDNPGSEPGVAAKLFEQLSQADKATLLAYVSAL